MRRSRLTISNTGIFVSSLLALVVLALCGLPVIAQDDASPSPTVREAVGFAVSPPVRELAKLPRAPQYGFHQGLRVRPIPKRDFGVAVDPVEQNTTIRRPSVDYTLGFDFLGVGNSFPGYSQADSFPDSNLAVGDNQVVQWANLSFAVFDKFNPTSYVGPIAGDALFAAMGGPCAATSNENFAVQWDNAAHRWLLAQNVLQGPPYYACVAVSTSADALGTYYLYQFPLGDGFPDYPKWGRWNTSWAETMNNFGPDGQTFMGPEVCVYERSKLLAGDPLARQKCFQLHIGSQCNTQHIGCQDSLLPADVDSPNSPPAAEDQFFIGSVADVNTTHLSLYSVHMDWMHPAMAYITGDNNSQLTTVPAYTLPCTGGLDPCVPQKGDTTRLWSLDDRLMYRFAYYNDGSGGKQHWYVNHAVQASGGQLGVRWYEFQAPQISITPPALMNGPFQSGTYSPDGTWRWMGSIAADRNNDILVGYSKSCGDTCPGGTATYPSIEVAGRLSSTPAGMLEPEVSVIAGTGSQTQSNPYWGSFSAMRLDPDGCTFWYTQEFYLLPDPFHWSTQIASAKFGGCRNSAYDGYIEICKQSDPDYPVTGTFDFTATAPFFNGGPYHVPVGTCSAPLLVPSGEITIAEAPQSGVAVENVTAYSYDPYGNYINELDSWTPPNLSATVTVVPGGVNLETVATFTNYAAPPGTLKICKIAGSDSLVGMPFTFNVTGLAPLQINAGPPPGGSCQIVGSFPVNSPVTVSETVPAGIRVTKIAVQPPDRGSQQTDHSVVIMIGTGITEVDFTDDLGVPTGSCQPSESLSVLLVNGTNVVAYVPLSNWLQPNMMDVAVANIEGSYITGTPVTAGVQDYINSCASNPLSTIPQTVCTANGSHVYIITGQNPFTITQLTSGGTGQITFSGGNCTNCGIAMDAVHQQAVIGLSHAGKPAFQFLNLSNDTFGAMLDSHAKQISEDILIDPVNNLLLSPAEGAHCLPVDPTCHANYEIADISNPASPVFWEYDLTKADGYPNKGEPDSSAEDCSAAIALSNTEVVNPSRPFVADLKQAVFPPGGGIWSDPLAAYFSLSGANLEPPNGDREENGPIAVAQGGSHIGILGQETFNGVANTITAFRINVPPYTVANPFGIGDWLTCNLGTDSTTLSAFVQGGDPHTLTAYQSPGGHQFPAGDAIAVIANEEPASSVAIVDLTKMLNTLPRCPAPNDHVCRPISSTCPTTGSLDGTGIATFLKVR